MAFTIKTALGAFWLLLFVCASQVLAAPVGLKTRDQNPMFQAYYLPSIDISLHKCSQTTISVYLINTFQNNRQGKETVLIDVENYQYDFSIAYKQDKWRL